MTAETSFSTLSMVSKVPLILAAKVPLIFAASDACCVLRWANHAEAFNR